MAVIMEVLKDNFFYIWLVLAVSMVKPMRVFKLYITLLILISSNFLNGQSLIGVYGGVNSSDFYDKSSTPHYSADYKSKNSYLFGFHFKERRDKLLNLTLGFDYLHRNVMINASYGGLGYWINRELDIDIYSLNFRILPEIKIGDRFGLYFNIGPYFGLIINSRKSGTGFSGSIEGSTDSWTESGNAKDEINRLDFGFSSSLGLEIPLTNRFFLLFDLNYGIGISDISRGSISSSAKRINSKNIYITGGLVYKLNDFTITEKLNEQYKTSKLQ